jgi:hypothetical protein
VRDDWTQNAVKAAFMRVFREESIRDVSESFSVDVDVCEPQKVVVRVHRMYEYVPVNASHLFSLANIFGTQNIEMDQYSSPGCDTCDWGSSFEVTFRVTP